MGKSCPEKLRKATEMLSGTENFSGRLRIARAKQGWVQADLARELGVSPGSVGNWESGQNTPSHRMLKRLSELLGTSVGWLLNGEASAPASVEPREGCPWLSDLEQRLRDLPEWRRRRVLAGFHAVLDAVEPVEHGQRAPGQPDIKVEESFDPVAAASRSGAAALRAAGLPMPPLRPVVAPPIESTPPPDATVPSDEGGRRPLRAPAPKAPVQKPRPAADLPRRSSAA